MDGKKAVLEVSVSDAKHAKDMRIAKITRAGIILSIVLILLALLGIGCVGLYRFLYTRNDYFLYSKLEFTPTPHYTARKVQTMLEVLEGDSACVIARTNLLTLDLGKLRSKLLENVMLEDVEIYRIMPDTLKVVFTERTPLAFISAGDVYNAMIDANGVFFPIHSAEDYKLGIPIISKVIGGDKVPLGTKTEDQALLAAVKFIEKVNSRPKIQGAGYNIAVIELKYDSKRLDCSFKRSLDNKVLRDNNLFCFPMDVTKMDAALERFDTILALKIKGNETISYADVTLEVNVPTRE